MPELPEVEVVRRGLERWINGRVIQTATVLHPRAVRRHRGGSIDFCAAVAGAHVRAIQRRGKYLWFSFADGRALVGHLGMSGQFLLNPPAAPHERHLRVRFSFRDGDRELRFVDQRTFGGLFVDECDAAGQPSSLFHIAPDVFGESFNEATFRAALARRSAGIKQVLLDQSLVSGVGNIYADEALWRAELHYLRPANSLSESELRSLIVELRAVFSDALAAGGTSFDALYVHVNGESGYFSRSLNAYGQTGRACSRCGAAIVRAAFANRSSHFCPTCQRL